MTRQRGSEAGMRVVDQEPANHWPISGKGSHPC